MVGIRFLQGGIAWMEVAGCINWATWELFCWHTQQSSFIQYQIQQYVPDSSFARGEKSLSLGPRRLGSAHCLLPFSEIKDCIFRLHLHLESFGHLTSFFFPRGLLLESPCPSLSFSHKRLLCLLHASLLKMFWAMYEVGQAEEEHRWRLPR